MPTRLQYEAITKRMAVMQDKAKADEARRLRLLEAQMKLRPMIDEAHAELGQDPQQLKKAMTEIISGYTLDTGAKVPQAFIDVMADPKAGPGILDLATKEGMTLGQLMDASGQPLLVAQGRIAAAKALRERQGRNAVAGEDEQPTPSRAPTPSLGAGLQVPGMAPSPQPFGEPAPQPSPVSPAPVAPTPAATMPQAPTPPLQAAVGALDNQIFQLKQRIRIATSTRQAPALLAPLQSQLQELEKRRHEMTGGFELEQAKGEAQAGRAQLPTEVVRDIGVAPGTTIGDVRRPGAQLPRLPTRGEIEAEKGRIENAQKEMKDIIDTGSSSQRLSNLTDIAVTAAQNAGVTGPWVTPTRETLMKMVNLLGVTPKGQAPLQLMESMTPQFAIELTRLMKGQQSDREFLAGVQSALNKGQTQQGFAVLAYLKKEQYALDMEKAVQARRWEGTRGSLATKDQNGRTFGEAWERYLEEDRQRNGTFGDRAANALKLDYRSVLKGDVKPRNPRATEGNIRAR